MQQLNFPNFDLTITISIIVTLTALISPIIVTLLNNHHQYKMKKLEIISDQKFSAIKKYLDGAGKFITYDCLENEIEYESGKGLVYLHTPSTCWDDIEQLDKAIRSKDQAAIAESFPKTCKQLSKTIKY